MDKIKLMAIDFDGTTLNSEKRITDATLQAISKAIKNGILIVPATGRSISGIPQQMHDMDIKYVISKNGAIIHDLTNGKEILKFTFRISIGDLVDSNILQLFPLSIVKQIVK